MKFRLVRIHCTLFCCGFTVCTRWITCFFYYSLSLTCHHMWGRLLPTPFQNSSGTICCKCLEFPTPVWSFLQFRYHSYFKYCFIFERRRVQSLWNILQNAILEYLAKKHFTLIDKSTIYKLLLCWFLFVSYCIYIIAWGICLTSLSSNCLWSLLVSLKNSEVLPGL